MLVGCIDSFQEPNMYNIIFLDADNKEMLLTVDVLSIAQTVHDTIAEAGYVMITERPH
jgi:hypothetical protein